MAAAALSIAGSVVPNPRDIAVKLITHYKDMKDGKKICQKIIEDLEMVLHLLKAIEQQDFKHTQQAVKNAIEKITKTLVEYEKKCFKETAKKVSLSP